MKETKFKGWFGVFGEQGQLIETIVVTVVWMATAVALIICLWKIIENGISLIGAGTEKRIETKQKMLNIGIGMGCVALSTTFATILWGTIGKFAIEQPEVAKTMLHSFSHLNLMQLSL